MKSQPHLVSTCVNTTSIMGVFYNRATAQKRTKWRVLSPFFKEKTTFIASFILFLKAPLCHQTAAYGMKLKRLKPLPIGANQWLHSFYERNYERKILKPLILFVISSKIGLFFTNVITNVSPQKGLFLGVFWGKKWKKRKKHPLTNVTTNVTTNVKL